METYATMWVYFIFCLILFAVYFILLNKRNEKISNKHSVYKEKNFKFYFKYSWTCLILQFTKMFGRQKIEKFDEELDKVQVLSENPLAFDAVFFAAASTDGVYIISGCERRRNNAVYAMFYLLLPDIGLLHHSTLPVTKMEANKNINVFGTEDFFFEPIKSMKEWRIFYNGKMRLHNSSQIFNVVIDGIWSSFQNCTQFDKGYVNIKALARAISLEPWSKEYFKNIKRSNGIRYEQFGTMRMSVLISERNIKIRTIASSFRDHHFGDVRDFSSIYRYAYFLIFLNSSTNIVIGIICHLTTFSRLEIGYVNNADGIHNSIQWCNLYLQNFGENGDPPTQYRFKFKAGKTTYTVEGNTVRQCHHYKGINSEALHIEQFSKFVVNGISCLGIVELHYNLKYFNKIKV